MKTIFISIFSIFLFGCFPKKENNIAFNITIDTISYSKDKKQISDCFMNKIEYFRKYHDYKFVIYTDSPDSIKNKYNDYYSQYPSADWDPANFFIPYASRTLIKNNSLINSPKPSLEQLVITTDAIIYNKNQTLCFAFVAIKTNFSNIEGLKDEIKKVDAKAVIGCRKNKNDPFEIYPVEKYEASGYGNPDRAIKDIEEFYFTKLKGDFLAGTQYEEKYGFNSNVGDANFFEIAPFFHKTKEGIYFFQIYQELGELKEYKYQKCN